MANFVREIASLREELLAKDAKLRDLQKTLREQPGEAQSEQLESARKEFHDVEQRFALVKSPNLSDTSLPSFLPVLVETLRKTLDAEFDLMRQLQSIQLATSVQLQLEQSWQEKEATDKQVQELVTQLERAQFQLEKVRTKADLKAAFADLDTIQLQLDEDYERNSKLQDKVRALEKEIRSMRHQALLRPSSPGGTSRTGILRRAVGEFIAMTLVQLAQVSSPAYDRPCTDHTTKFEWSHFPRLRFQPGIVPAPARQNTQACTG
ncbi:hypothetical protein R1flu_003220 [Riccia fluitans]|uniref:Uncharacterized protein n=1 Tax=Riccia fluitans TaxID=41844 RepID=A0ABD1Y8W4_9MARC